MSWQFALRGEGSESLELDVYGFINEYSWSGVSAGYVRRVLKENAKAKSIKVRINSKGGDVLEGFAIYNLLSEHQAHVSVTIDAIAASMASIVALAGDDITIASNAFFMIHNPFAIGIGEADDLRGTADMLDKMRDNMADIYVARTGLKRDDVIAMMDAETWLSADEAKAKGFVDTVVKAKKAEPKKAAAACFAMADLGSYSNMPAELRAAIEAARPPTPGEPTPEQRAENEREAAARAAAKDTTPEPPGPVNQSNDNTEARASLPEQETMTISKKILQALGLGDDGDEAAVCAAIERNKVQAHVGSEIEKLLGAVGAECIGAVRALKENQAQSAAMAQDLEKVKVAMNRSSFDALIKSGRDEQRKLSVAEAKLYTERFEAAVARGEDGAAVVSDLKGWLAVASRRHGAAPRANIEQDNVEGGGEGMPLKYNGKALEELKPREQASLKKANPDLYEAMRADAVAREAI